MCGRNNIIPHIFYGPFVFYSEKLCTLSSSGISTRRCFELKKYSRVEHFDYDKHETNVDRWKKTTTKSTSRRNSSINIKYSEFLLICLHSPPSMLQHETLLQLMFICFRNIFISGKKHIENGH